MIKTFALILALAWLSFSGQAFTQSYSEEDKAATQAEIEALNAELNKHLQAIESRDEELSDIESELRRLELKTAEIAGAIQKTSTELRGINSEIEKAQQELERLQAEQQKQLALLEEQIVSAYVNGDNDFLKMLLNQGSPAKLERLLTYYQYMNDARVEEIEQIKQTQADIEQLTAELTDKKADVVSLREQQAEQQQQLESQQREQEETLAKLQAEQRSDKAKIKQLEQSRAQLEQVLAAIEAALKRQGDVRLVGLKPIKSQLKWPSDGTVRRVFGQRREGPVEWKGVLIEGNNGQEVRSIADGRIVYADWLRGFGLVIVVDHGENYMSLYGHNQALLRTVGEKVKKDEEIALMGQSGSRDKASLYFEIRHQGKPQNPSHWIR
ncbi:murein hydrolase activator EnvC family protein [Idiomarina sp. UBA4520]|jgi:septal ring factor EnvC (AmiA/AmiB activator)|uniref:murein hydrolase activator EnvC family protein n=1 Tax=Idiomarina sp. UBA4520 TaxID=1946647 RepID=UPI000B036371|nr:MULTISPECIES: peptidoglycan DD-metalloendopeptidase family protein [unclassified Idiomarina]|tara:strand:- start:8150 stop:9298 length:1149 start_codon:yes stop_codon:yes gene_type:complete